VKHSCWRTSTGASAAANSLLSCVTATSDVGAWLVLAEEGDGAVAATVWISSRVIANAVATATEAERLNVCAADVTGAMNVAGAAARTTVALRRWLRTGIGARAAIVRIGLSVNTCPAAVGLPIHTDAVAYVRVKGLSFWTAVGIDTTAVTAVSWGAATSILSRTAGISAPAAQSLQTPGKRATNLFPDCRLATAKIGADFALRGVTALSQTGRTSADTATTGAGSGRPIGAARSVGQCHARPGRTVANVAAVAAAGLERLT
jgi:hypothetical protein